MPVAKIVMFSDPATDATRAAKRLLEKHHLSWTEKDISKDVESNAFIRKLCGGPASPVFYIEEKWLPEPSQEELLEACKVRFDPGSIDTRGRTCFDVIVIGLGPAGLAACHGCRLGGMSVLGIDENSPGGHMLNLTDVDEYFGVGYDEPISGADVAENFSNHARHVGAVLMKGKVNSIRIEGLYKQVQTSQGTFWSRAVIVATGASQRELNAEGVTKYINRGIRYGAQIDAAIYKDRRVIVIGAGDEAVHAGIFLSHHAKNVMLLCPEDNPTAEPLLVERAIASKVRLLMGITVEAVKGNEYLEYVFFKEKGIPEEQCLPSDAMVIALGPAPRKPIPGLERLPQENSYFAHGEGGKTMFGGIYVAGDCTDLSTRTLMGVVSSGNLCAKRVWQWLASHPLPKLR